MLAMLMQLLVGCSDDVIVEDYYRSNAELARETTPFNNSQAPSAAAEALAMQSRSSNTINSKSTTNSGRLVRIRMDASVFSGTNRPAMVSTLEGLRQRHGPSLERYFDGIGFDDSWRKRFRAVFGNNSNHRSNSDHGSNPSSRL